MWQQSQYDEHQDEPNEAWRGDVHLDDESWLGGADTEAWRGDADAESWQDVPDAEKWRGEDHLADWPEESAGPEYWMFKEIGRASCRGRGWSVGVGRDVLKSVDESG